MIPSVRYRVAYLPNGVSRVFDVQVLENAQPLPGSERAILDEETHLPEALAAAGMTFTGPWAGYVVAGKDDGEIDVLAVKV